MLAKPFYANKALPKNWESFLNTASSGYATLAANVVVWKWLKIMPSIVR
jgi:hypothetical protein